VAIGFGSGTSGTLDQDQDQDQGWTTTAHHTLPTYKLSTSDIQALYFLRYRLAKKSVKGKKGKGRVLDIALLHHEHMPRSAL